MSDSLDDDVDIVEVVRIDERAIMGDEFRDYVISAIRRGVRKPFGGQHVLGVMHGTQVTETTREFVVAFLIGDERMGEEYDE